MAEIGLLKQKRHLTESNQIQFVWVVFIGTRYKLDGI